MATALASVPDLTVADPVQAIARWERAVAADFIARDVEIHLFALALAARESLYLLGLPGLAKTEVIERGKLYIATICGRCGEIVTEFDGATTASERWHHVRTNLAACATGGAVDPRGRMFVVQLGAQSTRDETEGPVSLKGLENDEYRRMVTGYSADAEIVVWDEGNKASKSLQHTALRLMQERKYKDNGIDKRAPLCTFVVPTNEEADSEEQAAFDDRLQIRRIVTRPRDRDEVIAMLKLVRVDEPQPVCTWADWVAVQEMVKTIPVANDVYGMIADIERDLLNGGVDLTPRRLRKSLVVVKAEAVLAGADTVETDHVAILEHCAWMRAKDQPTAQQIVLKRAAPMQHAGLQLLADVEKIGVEVDTLIDGALAKGVDPDSDEAVKLQKALKQANRKITTLRGDGSGPRRQLELADRVGTRHRQIAAKLLVNAFDIPAAAVESMLNKDRD